MANDQANDQATFIAYTSEVDPQDYLGGVTVRVFEMGLSLPWHEPVLAKAVRTVFQRNAVIFQYNSVGGRAASHPKHHCGSQQTLCLVPSLGCPTLVYVKASEW